MGQPNEINSCTIGTLNSLRDLVLSGIKKSEFEETASLYE